MKRVMALAAALLLASLLVRLLLAQSPAPPPLQAPPPPTYTLTDLGPLNITAAPSGATTLNASGQVAGFRFENFQSPVCFAGGADRAFLWDQTMPDPATNSPYTELGTLGGFSSFAYGINNAGQIVGSSDACPNGIEVGQRAFIWQRVNGKGVMTALDTSTNSNDGSVAFAININGDVAGYTNHVGNAANPQAVIWKGGTAAGLTMLQSLACQFNACQTRALAINDSGQAAGWGQGPFVTGPLGSYNSNQAVLWDSNGQPTGLGSLGNFFNDQANAINSKGDVVGYSLIDPHTIHAVLWQNGNPQNPQDLGAIPGIDPIFGAGANITDNNSSAWGINSQGQIVGVSGDGTNTATLGSGGRAFLYTNGQMYDLLSRLAPGTNWTRLEAAWAINDNGQIVGVGFDPNQQEHGFLLTPIITPTRMAVSAPTATTAGTSFNFTATVQDQFGNTATNYVGTVHFTSSDGQGALPADYTFTATDGGVHIFSATLNTAGNQTITATDTANATITGTSNMITVSVSLARHFAVAAPPSATAGASFSFSVTALDQSNNTAKNYTGTVQFTSTDGQAALPAAYTFTAADNGTHTFTATLNTAGSQTVTATDLANARVTGTSNTIVVTAAVPPPLQITVNEAVHVTDSESFPDAVDTEAVKVTDRVTVTPLINVGGPVAEYSAASLGFSGQSGTQTITVSDIGQAPLILSSATISGSSQFVITQISCSNTATSLSTSLPSGGACLITVGYTASATPANDSGSLVFTDNAALSNVSSVPAGSSYTQSISLNGPGSNVAPPPPPPATVYVTDTENIFVADTNSFNDVFDTEKITITDQVNIQLLNTTATSISAPSVTYGTVPSVTVSVIASTGVASGNVTLAVDGRAATTMPLTSHFDPLLELAVGSATFDLGILQAGNHALVANFAPQGGFAGSSAQVTLVVNQATPTITWTSPSYIFNTTPLGSTQLNATASVPGSFIYSPPSGTVLSVGTQSLAVTFTPTDTVNYATAAASVNVNVVTRQTTTTSVSCGNGSPVNMGSSVSCNASVSSFDGTVPEGNVTWTATGPIPNPGAFFTTSALYGNSYTNVCQLPFQSLGGKPEPGNGNSCGLAYQPAPASDGITTITANYAGDGAHSPSSGSVSITVQGLAVPVIFWCPSGQFIQFGSSQICTQTSITYGTPLPAAFLNATASVPGTFVYNPPAGTILGVSSSFCPSLQVTFTPTDSTHYTTAVAGTAICVNQATPTITWPTPAAIVYLTPLGTRQLNATASVAGSFSYTPALGTILTAGNHVLSATFTPTDSTDYNTATAAVTITVLNTPAGTNVKTTPADAATGAAPATLSFSNVSQAGVTSLAISSSGPAAPPGFKPGAPATYYNLSTTAVFTPPVTVCVNYAGTTFSSSSGPQLFHYQNGAWTNITTSVDTANMIACGQASSFSPFALFAPLPVLTINANSFSRQYGAADPSLTVSYKGFVNGDTSAVLSGTLKCTSSDSGSSPVGPHAINCSGLSSPNYMINFVPGTLTVTPAPLSIAAGSRSKTYGQTVTFAGTEFMPNGLVNGDTVSSVTLTSPGASLTAAVAGSPYSILASAAVGTGLSNYNIMYSAGALTVMPATLTITAGSPSKVLDAPNPSRFPWTATGFVNGENTSILTSNPTCTTAATSTSPVGSYAITCSGANAANYTFVYVPGTLTILYASTIGHTIQPPINADGTSVFKQGRTIPAMFNVYDANGVPIATPGVVSSFYLTAIVSGTVTTTVENVVDTNNPDTAFRWDGQEWIFNITTGNLAAGRTYIYTISLNDGSAIGFQYGLR